MKSIYTEHQTQTQIINFLRIKGWYVMRLNSGKMRYTNSSGKQKFVMLQDPGTPDIVAFRQDISLRTVEVGVKLIFIEVKVPGNKPTWLQQQKMQELEKYGAKCFVATSVEDVEKLI